MTLAANFATGTAGVATGISDTGGKFATGVNWNNIRMLTH
jgi:hypothetical protein